MKNNTYDLKKIKAVIGIDESSPDNFHATLPFSINDASIGVENEFQTAIEGDASNVDLACQIKESSYFKNLQRRVQTGDMPRKSIYRLEGYLNSNQYNIWENSWGTFPRRTLNQYADDTLEEDLLADKKEPNGSKRSDFDSFVIKRGKEYFLRLPISYLLKLALADTIGNGNVGDLTKRIGKRLLGHFLNDNTSPEIHSFYVSPLKVSRGMGKAIARETLQRFLLTQLLSSYANKKFELDKNGQKIKLYFAPHPPVRQKMLNDIVPDSFYRNLYISPCLSGWDKGQEKMEYMELCHRVMSRSHLNAISKLKEAGIINNNLIVLPNTSNIGLANNGTHISLGSKKLTHLVKTGNKDFNSEHEKYYGDLTIKIVEHFIPLFVGNYSAAPYRLDFDDFHPEKALGFLSHELDYTHLRMIWRRWKKKANLKFFGQPLSPYGPQWIDSIISKIFFLEGDFVPDFRLIDYLVALMSTDESPALDGKLGNDDRLKKDLQDFGVFDSRMSLYLQYKLRQVSTVGFSGYEGRYYSLFHNIMDDMSEGANLQLLLTLIAQKYIFSGKIGHHNIGDTPDVESSRRQIFFGKAIGLPTFYVNKDVKDTFLLEIIKRTKKVRTSHRYPGYLRIHHEHYQKALLEIIKEDGAEFIEMLELQKTIKSLEEKLNNPELSVHNRLTKEICEFGNIKSPLKVGSHDFNITAEAYYRDQLRNSHLIEALDVLAEDCKNIDYANGFSKSELADELNTVLDGQSAFDYIKSVKPKLLDDSISIEELNRTIQITLLIIESFTNNNY